jgi:hypothetical protein
MGVCPGLYDDPHRRSLTGGAHPSSRLAPTTLTQLSRCGTLGCCIIQAGQAPHGRVVNITHGLPQVRSDPVDG